MKERIIKILSIIGLIPLTMGVFFLGQLPLIEGKHIINPFIDTQFGENYTPEKFEKIAIGMTLEQVKQIVGEPLYKGQGYRDTTNNNYHYTGDAKLLYSDKDRRGNSYDDFAWYRSTIEVDTNNIVVYIDKGWSYD